MNDIHPIKPPIELAVFSEKMINFALFFLLFLFLAFLFFYLKKRKVNLSNKIEMPVELEEEIDYCQIAKLELEKVKKYIEVGEFKVFQLEVSSIVKIYLSGIWKKNFSEMTSIEILQNERITSDLKKFLGEFLIISDREKFAKAKQKKKHAEKVYDLALLIIEKK